MPFNLLKKDLKEIEIHQNLDELLEQQVKAESNSKFLFILFSAMTTLFLIISCIVGMRSNAHFTAWLYSVSSNMFLFVLCSLLSLSASFALYSLSVQFKQYCLTHYYEYTTHSDAIKNEYRAHSLAVRGMKIIIASLMVYGVSTFLKFDWVDSVRIVCSIGIVVGMVVYSKSELIRSGFEKI